MSRTDLFEIDMDDYWTLLSSEDRELLWKWVQIETGYAPLIYRLRLDGEGTMTTMEYLSSMRSGAIPLVSWCAHGCGVKCTGGTIISIKRRYRLSTPPPAWKPRGSG